MSISSVTTPSSPAGAYVHNALLYQWQEDYDYTAIADSGGNLRITVASGTASAFEVGEFIWLSALVDFELIESPVVEITAKGATTLTLNVAYNAGYSSTGTLRGMKSLPFVVQTGFGTTTQQLRQRVFNLRPDPDGRYSLNPYQEIISRFDFGAPVVGRSGDEAAAVQYRAYPQSVGTGTYIYAFKSISGNSVAPVIRYNDLVNIVSYIPTGGTQIKSDLESEATQELTTAGTVEIESEIYGFDCASYEVTFSAPFDEGFTTYTPEAWVTVAVSGQNITGLTFDLTQLAAGEHSWGLEYDDGVNTKTLNFTVFVQEALDCRASCGGRRFFWWQRGGGWASYEFSLAINESIAGGASQLKQVGNVVSPVKYERQQEAVGLIANYEAQAVFDYLKGMLFALNVFEATTFTRLSQVYDLYYLPNANGVNKQTQPYLATSNRFEIALVRGTIEERINEAQ